jgi:hypothetical protein
MVEKIKDRTAEILLGIIITVFLGWAAWTSLSILTLNGEAAIVKTQYGFISEKLCKIEGILERHTGATKE